jgi:hypothetical protein
MDSQQSGELAALVREGDDQRQLAEIGTVAAANEETWKRRMSLSLRERDSC